MAKWFVLHPLGNRVGVLFDEKDRTREAEYLTLNEAKFRAAFRGVREAQL